MDKECVERKLDKIDLKLLNNMDCTDDVSEILGMIADDFNNMSDEEKFMYKNDSRYADILLSEKLNEVSQDPAENIYQYIRLLLDLLDEIDVRLEDHEETKYHSLMCSSVSGMLSKSVSEFYENDIEDLQRFNEYIMVEFVDYKDFKTAIRDEAETVFRLELCSDEAHFHLSALIVLMADLIIFA